METHFMDPDPDTYTDAWRHSLRLDSGTALRFHGQLSVSVPWVSFITTASLVSVLITESCLAPFYLPQKI